MDDIRTGTLSSVLRVDQVRKLGKFFALTAADGGWRIAIIDGADEMNVNAANAVLKILEEPPAKAILLLTSTASSRVLPTIRSRCRKLGLRPLGPEALGCAVESQRPDISGGDLAALRHLSEGSPGRALSLADAGGVEVYRELIGLLESLPTLDNQAVHALGDRLARREQSQSYATWIEFLGLWLNRLVLSGAGRAPAEVVAGETSLGQRLLALSSLDRWLELWDKIDRLSSRAERVHLERKHVVLNCLLAVEATARN